jgi:hypothetical protein
MKLTDHIRLIWTNRKFVHYAGNFTFEDGLPPPTQTELDATREQALALFAAEQEAKEKRPVYSVTMGALRRALGRTRCIQISAWIGGIQDVDQRHAISSWWEYAPTVRSTHPAIPQFQQVLGLDDAQADAIFAAAYAEDNA